MKNKLLILSVAIIMILAVLTGCTTKTVDTPNSGAPKDAGITDRKVEEPKAEGNNTQFPIAISHSLGEVTIESVPQKVIVFDMATLDTMNVLNIDAELAGPTTSIPGLLEEYAQNMVSVGTMKGPDLEAIVSFEPDLIIISGRQMENYDDLKSIAPTLFVDLRAETYMEDFVNNVKNIGRIFDINDSTDSHLAEIDVLISETRAKVEKSDAKTLFIMSNDGNISAYGSGSRFGIVYDILGAKEIDESIDVTTHGQSIGFEYIAEKNPNVLFVVDRGVISSDAVTNASTTLDNDLVKSTNAFKNDKIVYLTSDIWYLAGGGLSTIVTMINEISNAY